MSENDDPASAKLKQSPYTGEHGYDYYPNRCEAARGGEEKDGISSYFRDFFKSPRRTLACFNNVYKCANNNPAVKLLLRALESKGCPVDLKRHVSCEDCISRVNGGYDPVHNQVVVCQNNTMNEGTACNVLGHELTHMFDRCRTKMDFDNLDHLACTEIRAANFFHCTFLTAYLQGDMKRWRYHASQKNCVKRKALMSIMLARAVDEATATAAVERVFDKCYNDLEPFGRIPKTRTRDYEMAMEEGVYYGYFPSKQKAKQNEDDDK